MDNFNVFAGAFVDRRGEHRLDAAWLSSALASQKSNFVPVHDDKCLVIGDPPRLALLEREEVGSYLANGAETIFLGLFRDKPAFAVIIESDVEPPTAELGQYQDLRFIGTMMPADEANLAAHARALAIWHRSQLFCGACGSSSRPEAGGNTRRCENPKCGRSLFPRVDPAIIVLVENGDRCLLGRQAAWPEHRYSTIAGFVEPGESLEDAVRREVFEETNIHVSDVHYHSSQPWPFPSSLMLGFVAKATSEDIVLNDGELEDARWFTRDDLNSDFPKLPFRISIARRLVDHWLAAG
ncbi:MAG: NAD(+) diphosphatase [Woeseiaceae bacterium]|nr:NAD(+) diphosphatase [Woeseiaceae bacterium]